MKWILIAVIMFVGVQCAYADIDEEIDNFRVSRLQAEAGVRAIKANFKPAQKQYETGKQMYSAAQSAYNTYTAALLDNYRLGKKEKLDRTAEAASSAEKKFKDYVKSLKIQMGVPVIIMALPFLIDLVSKVYSYIDKMGQDDRDRYAKIKAPEITWLDWDKIN